MKINTSIAIFSLLCFSLTLLPMEVERGSRTFLIENTTDDTVKILTKIDEGNEIEALITPKDKAVFCFNRSIDSFLVQGTGMLSAWNRQDHTLEVADLVSDKPQADISGKIQAPEEEGFFSAFASYVKPYKVLIEDVEPIKWELLVIPSSVRVLDLFPAVKQALEKSPSGPLVVTDFFAVSGDVSPEALKEKFQLLLTMWKELAATTQNPTHRAFANKVVKILDKAYLVAQMTPEAVGEAAMRVTGFVPKDPQQREALGKVSGQVLQRLSAARAQKELRKLLEEPK